MIDFSSTNPVVVSYPAFSGGKFIVNCLSLSRHSCLMDNRSAVHVLKNPGDYEFRLQQVMATLPLKEDLLNWQRYEFDEVKLYGKHFETLPVPEQLAPIVEQLSKSNLKFYTIDHNGPPNINNTLSIWPNATVVRLINCRHFQNISIQLKSTRHDATQLCGNYCEEKYNQLCGPSWPSWEEFDQVGHDVRRIPNVDDTVISEINQYYPWNTVSNNVVQFDMDACIFDETKFLESMQQLYQTLGLDDFNRELVLKFYQAYINLHY